MVIHLVAGGIMSHIEISGLSEGEFVEDYYAVKEASLNMTSSGKPYIRLTLSDATGSISANMWDGSKELFSTFSAGSVVKVQALVETYRGALQLKVNRLRKAENDEADSADFLPSTTADINELKDELRRFLDSITDPDYSALLNAFFDDPEIYNKFCTSPAATGNHHAYIGGLLEHTVSLARYADVFCKNSPARLNRDLLLAGVFLHDIGKIEELEAGAVIRYTDRGGLLGHLIIGAMMVEQRAEALPNIDETKKMLLQHMILSHHGRYEYGSPVLPKIPEALALHHIDNLDAKTVAARRVIDEDETDDNWTARNWMFETKLFKTPASPNVTGQDATRSGEDDSALENAVDEDAEAPTDKSGGGLFDDLL